jgi:multimeric flavodoxin WrbA
MNNDLTRRGFLGATGAATVGALAGAAAADAAETEPAATSIKIVGIGCSPRAESTTAVAVGACLEAARQVAPDRIEIELITLAGLKIPAAVAAGVALEPGEQDDFPKLAPKLADPKVAGIIIGSPVYFSNMSSLCKAFLERFMTFRKDFALSNKVAGALAVGGARNGGQELTIRSIHNCLFGQEMIIVGESRPSSHFGPCVWNNKEFESITDDEVGMGTVANLGRRVAEVALALAAK